ncbi:MAG TPA: DUF4263 domain-containing protein [Elusimicrobiota bacterium]|nr:DUF4263 domain-containing protein [Elusimicrobiota bacterium]
MTKKKKKNPEVSIKHFDLKEGTFCVYEIFSRSKKTVYNLRGGQSNHISKITLDGYQGLPAGLYLNKNGFGFGKKGVFLLSALKQHLSEGKAVELVISSQFRKTIKKGLVATIVTLPYQDVCNLLVRLGRINEDNNNELRGAVASFLSTKFPTRIKIAPSTFDDYQGGEISALLRRNKVAQKLNEEDIQELRGFFPKIFATSLKGRKKGVRAERDALIRDTKSATDRIYLDDVIKDFEVNLAKKTLREEKWQKFLKDKVFRFMASYVTSIDKQNISLDISYPDFVLVDVYGFIDVFEIKRHDTRLLAFDESHDNYYWKPEIAQAISQIENYIDAIIHNSDNYVRTVKRKKHVNVRVVRPRGYIIAGASRQFETEKEFEDFHKLGTSLKNISFILYDELLEKLKNLRTKL